MAAADTVALPVDPSEPIPLSALQHAVYCLRQAALIHLERQWEENVFTAEGQVLHAAADLPGRRKVRGVRRVSALPIGSRALNISGIADLVEFRRAGEVEVPFPIEIKRGKPKRHRADEVQLCAQALCLEDMTGTAVPDGALFYAQTRRRLEIVFDAELRELTRDVIEQLAAVFRSLETPPPTVHKARCKGCSLHDLCRPEAVVRPAASWRRRSVERLLVETDLLP